MKEFKYKTSFSATLRPLVAEVKDKYLAMASLIDVGDFIPDIDTDSNVDLLPVAFNAFVANRVNKNGDVINTATSVDIFQNFVNKPINLEHNRERVVGVILSAGFSEFGTDKAMKDVPREFLGPFNVTLGGVIWKVVNSELADIVEESNDPTSTSYQSVSASWELGFEDYDLVLLDENQKNIEHGDYVTESTEVQRLQSHLRANGGEGRLENGKYVYRRVKGHVVPLGIGLTENPAADVSGVATRQRLLPEDKGYKKPYDVYDKWAENDSKQESDQPKIESSQETKINVIKSEKIKDNKVMNKINSIKDITDENLKEISASAISEFIEQELEKQAGEHDEAVRKQQDILESTEDKHKQLEDEHKTLEDELAKVKEALESLEKDKLEKEAQEQFNQRMASLDEEYDLNDKAKEVLATDIKGMSDEDFNIYKTKMEIFLSKKEEVVEEVTTEEPAEVKVEATQEEQPTAQLAEEVLDNAEAEAQDVPVSSETEEPTLYEKYKNAFGFDQFDIKHR